MIAFGRFRWRLAVLLVLLVVPMGIRPTLGAARPNIVFIFSDDHALQAIGAYGSKINRTPNIDRIAREGAIFVNSFCANSLCGPSRACVLTGKHSHLNGFMRNGNRFDPEQTTFPHLLQQAGYQTALIGKWHLETKPVGFDHWMILPGQGNYYNPDFLMMDGRRERLAGYCTDVITEHAVQWLKEGRSNDRPFLLMCQHKAPHRNWSPAERHFTMFAGETIPEPSTFLDDYAGRSRLLSENEMTLRKHLHWGHDMKFHGPNAFPQFFADGIPNEEYTRMDERQKAAWDAQYEPENQAFLQRLRTENLTEEDVLHWKYQRYIKDYLRCVAAVDDSVGRLLAYLDESGLAQNTIVIYASDQGFYLGEHGWYDKRWMYEESLKMPFVVRWPAMIASGTRSEALVQNIDYAPTFLEAAGVEVPAEIQGRSLIPLWRNAGMTPRDWRDAVYYAYYENVDVHNVPLHDGVRTKQFKLIHFLQTDEWQLIDLEADPHELRSCHTDPAYAEVFAGMQKRYHDLRRHYQVNSAVIPTTKAGEPAWRDRAQLLDKRLQEQTGELLFIGDSITQGWESEGRELWEKHFASRQAINLGISGDRTEHVLWRITHGPLTTDKVKPRAMVLMVGTNNTGHLQQDPHEVAAGVAMIVTTLHRQQPQAKIIVHAVFPRGASTWDKLRLHNQAINDLLRERPWEQQMENDAARRRIAEQTLYLDIGHAFLESDQSISARVMPDALHLSAEGYRRWAEALEPTLKLLGL